MTVDSDSPILHRHDDIKDTAEELQTFLDNVAAKDGIQRSSPQLDAWYSDALGLLAGITSGKVTKGQPRIVERLIQIVENYPDGKDPSKVIQAISHCSEFGISADGQEFSRGIGLGSSSLSR